MLVLGIDTSCDDTSAAVVEDGARILSNIVSSQEAIHRRYGGIVPELASRSHVEMVWPVVDEALREARADLGSLAAVAVCHGPGLIGSLLVGCSFAKALAFSTRLPLVAVNHLEGHIFSCFLKDSMPGDERQHALTEYPFLSLVVSGGHTCFYRVDGFGRYRELGRTRDDAAGEAYDKVAKLLGLGYPGGPAIDRLAHEGNPRTVLFPRAYLPESLDFSFSGLKTAVLNHVRGGEAASVVDICAGFQEAVVEILVRKTERALKQEGLCRLSVSGGVGANSALRSGLVRMAADKGVTLILPPRSLCTDNAAMIASAGYHHVVAGRFASAGMNPVAYLPL